MINQRLISICSFFFLFLCTTGFGQQRSIQKKVNPAASKRSVLNRNARSFDGKVENGIYSNEYFGFSFQMPDSWFYINKTEFVPVSSENSKISILKTEREKDGSLYLIGFVHYPYSKAIFAVKSRKFVLQDKGSLVNLAEKSRKESMNNSFYKVRTAKEVSRTLIDGETAYAFELAFENDREKYWQTIYFIKRQDDYLEIAWATDKEEEKDFVNEILATFKIKK